LSMFEDPSDRAGSSPLKPFACAPWPGDDEFEPVPGVAPREGAFGVVWKYKWRPAMGEVQARRYVALKFISEERAALSAIEEALALRAGLGVRSVVKLVKVFRVPDPTHAGKQVVVVATEWVEGVPLDAWIVGREALSPLDVADILCDIADVLDAYHHRPPAPPDWSDGFDSLLRALGDVKPSNAIVTRANGRVHATVCDLGVSAVIGQGRFPAWVPLRAAPEVLAGDLARGESDYYQLGLVGAELILLKPLEHLLADHGITTAAFEPKHELAIRVSETVIRELQTDQSTPEVLRVLVTRLLTIDPAERATCADVSQARAELFRATSDQSSRDHPADEHDRDTGQTLGAPGGAGPPAARVNAKNSRGTGRRETKRQRTRPRLRPATQQPSARSGSQELPQLPHVTLPAISDTGTGITEEERTLWQATFTDLRCPDA
jgi:serine/threonine protein kinase